MCSSLQDLTIYIKNGLTCHSYIAALSMFFFLKSGQCHPSGDLVLTEV